MESEKIGELIARVDYRGIETMLSRNPELANEEIPLDDNPAKAHLLHRLCDGVFSKIYTDRQAVEMARIFLSFGARVNGNMPNEKNDTPLVAAASLNADELALLYIEHGADIDHPGCHGGTALHWAAWCGRDQLVNRLIREGASINRLCIDFKSTPLLWAAHGYKSGGNNNRSSYIECVRLLLQAGADKLIPNREGVFPVQFVADDDSEFRNLFK
jgi:ankyrin repeat protein